MVERLRLNISVEEASRAAQAVQVELAAILLKGKVQILSSDERKMKDILEGMNFVLEPFLPNYASYAPPARSWSRLEGTEEAKAFLEGRENQVTNLIGNGVKASLDGLKKIAEIT